MIQLKQYQEESMRFEVVDEEGWKARLNELLSPPGSQNHG